MDKKLLYVTGTLFSLASSTPLNLTSTHTNPSSSSSSLSTSSTTTRTQITTTKYTRQRPSVQAKCYDGYGPCLPVKDTKIWLSSINLHLQKASNDVLISRIFSKRGIERYKRFLPGKMEFYRTEFEFCDKDGNNFISYQENQVCQDLAEKLIKKQLIHQGWSPDEIPDVLFKVNMTKLNREVQKTTGLDFDQYGKLKIFLAMVWGRAIFKKHDSYGDKRNGYVCISEWSDTQAYLRTLFSGYKRKIAMQHFGEFDYNRSGALEETELYYLFDHLWFRWFSTLGQNVY